MEWLVEPGFGPIEEQVGSTVQAAAESLAGLGAIVEPVRIPALERHSALDVFNRLHVMEMKPAFEPAAAGRADHKLYKKVRTMLSPPDTSMKDLIQAEQAAERLRDGFAEFFRKYDALIPPVLPDIRPSHGAEEVDINGKKVPIIRPQAAEFRST